MEDIEKKKVIMSHESIKDIDQIRIYGEETFGNRKADEYHQLLMEAVKSLDVLRVVHSASSNHKIRSARTVKIFKN